MINIKNKYRRYVTIYAILCFIISIIFVFEDNIQFPDILSTFNNETIMKLVTSAILSPLLVIASLIILNFIPTKVKDILIFWKIKNILPSYRWKKIVINDDRIDIKSINKIYGKNLSATRQHNIWYKKYKQNESDVRILDSQKDYLFARDLCVITLVLLGILSMLFLYGILKLNASVYNSMVVITALSTLYFIFMAIARNSANRFVCNVLLIDISKNII